jgi:hypothetical protein
MGAVVLMASIDEVHALLERIMLRLRLIEERRIPADMIQLDEGLSNLSDNFGIIKAGEIRFGTGEPGKGGGFTGIRITSQGMLYGSTDYLMAGINADALQWGIRTADGTLDTG